MLANHVSLTQGDTALDGRIKPANLGSGPDDGTVTDFAVRADASAVQNLGGSRDFAAFGDDNVLFDNDKRADMDRGMNFRLWGNDCGGMYGH